MKMDDLINASTLSDSLVLYDFSKQSVGYYMVKGEWFCPEIAKKGWHVNFCIKMDDLSNASTLSDSLALYDFSKQRVG